ncbi:MAG: AmmeMemoRadiSam system radical SAM enzyme [Planctomycetota bacterium]
MATLKQQLATRTRPAAPELIERLPNGRIQCHACGHRCRIRPGGDGICRVRFHRDGELRVPFGYVGALQIDPIEKKPFFHAFPGHTALSFGMLGCDFHCSYCQNWVTSQTLRDENATVRPRDIGAAELVALAQQNGAPVVVSTYNEPLITSEWAVEIFACARAAGLTCGFVSNGNATEEALSYLRPHTDLYKVDLKGFDDRRYRSLGGVLAHVLETIERTKAMDFWVEVVTLLIPGFNDSDDEMRGMARFIAGVSTDIPWHVTAFHPDYKMTDRGGTPAATLLRAYEHGRAAGLHFVYPGNLPGNVGDTESTFCPGCETRLIHRRGFTVLENRLRDGACPDCARVIPGHWGDRPLERSNHSGLPQPLA